MMPGAKHHNPTPDAKREPWQERILEPLTPGPDPAFRLAHRHFPRLVRTFGHSPDEGLALARALAGEMEARIREMGGEVKPPDGQNETKRRARIRDEPGSTR